MKKTIPISSNETVFYREWLEVLSILPPFSNFSPKERNLIAVLMELNNKYKHLEDKDKGALLLSTPNRKLAMERLKITNVQVFNNLVATVRKKGALNGGLLNSLFAVYPSKENELIFKFTING